jgi:protein-S-isoprenylcysteine O-methyltransferase Ste14
MGPYSVIRHPVYLGEVVALGIGTTRRARLGSCRDCIEPPDEPLNCTALKSIQIWISAPYIIRSRAIMAHPTGESESDTLRPDFDRRLKPETGAKV